MNKNPARALLLLPAALLLAGSGCSPPNNPGRDVVSKPQTPEQKQAVQDRLQNDPTLHGRFRGAGPQAGPANAPPWVKPGTSAGPPASGR